MSFLFKCAVVLLPWTIRRRLLVWCFGYKIHREARISLSWVFPRELEMAAGSRIGPFCVAIHLDRIQIGKSSSIGRRCWITGFPTKTDSKHFIHQPTRASELMVGEHSAITKNHHLDCTNLIRIGDFVTVAGYSSQLLTHSIDLDHNRQSSEPIEIGDYAFVGTNVVILGGSRLPSFSVLGACSLLNKPYTESYTLYAGVPARAVQTLPQNTKYFNRTNGFVW